MARSWRPNALISRMSISFFDSAGRSTNSDGRPGRRFGGSLLASRANQKVPKRSEKVRPAMGLSVAAGFQGPAKWKVASASRFSIVVQQLFCRCAQTFWNRKKCGSPFIASQFCDSSPGRGCGHSNGARVAWAQGRPNNDDLFARDE